MTMNTPKTPVTYQFIPGLELNEGFFHDVVKPILARNYPQLRYSAALIGYGSDVLSVDTSISMDHNWGPRLRIFLSEQDFGTLAASLNSILREQLPVSYKGFPTNYTDKRDDLTQTMLPVETGPVNHLIESHTIAEFVKHTIGADLSNECSLLDWLSFPEQGLIELTKGQVYADGLQTLQPLRKQFAFYPHDIWLIKMSALWQAISNEEPFIGRCADQGDTIGATLLTARLVNLLMKLCFYLEKQYIPYSKWFGTCFQRLACAKKLVPLFHAMLNPADTKCRDAKLAEVYDRIGVMHNALGMTAPIDFTMTSFYGRPYQVIFAVRIAECLKAAVEEPALSKVDLDLAGLEVITDGIDFTEHKTFLQIIADLITRVGKEKLAEGKF